MRPVVLTVAGSDSSGGAGIQADLKAIEANGGWAATVITAVTAQNTLGVRRIEVLRPEVVRAQLDAVAIDLPLAAVKSGMLGGASVIREFADWLGDHRPAHYVCDPVLVSSSGTPLLPEADRATLLERLFPHATLLTPNVAEAALLTGIEIDGPRQAERAARRLIEFGPPAVLVKGGHLPGPSAVDLLVTADGVQRFEAPRLDSRHTHGTGCLYASALAAHLAHGRPLVEAVRRAKAFVSAAIEHGFALGRGVGPADPWLGRVGAADDAASTREVG